MDGNDYEKTAAPSYADCTGKRFSGREIRQAVVKASICDRPHVRPMLNDRR